MLPTAYRWRIDAQGAYLDYNAGNVAHVIRKRGQLWTVIRFRGHVHEARCGSIQQGVRWINRWIERRPELPGGGKRHWYDRSGGVDPGIFEIRGPAPFKPNG